MHLVATSYFNSTVKTEEAYPAELLSETDKATTPVELPAETDEAASTAELPQEVDDISSTAELPPDGERQPQKNSLPSRAPSRG